MLATLSPPRRRFYLGLGALLVAGGVAVAVSLIARGPARVVPVSQDAQPPVLLVPGYGGSTGALQVLDGVLQQTGRSVEIVSLGGDDRGDLRRQADRLDSAVNATLARTGAHSVDLVGYSAGGVVVRLWVADHHGGSIARRIVTLGSPQHGTDVAGVGSDLTPDTCPTACQQLSPGSALIETLNAHDETPPGPRWVSIWTDQDATVVPPDSASLTGAIDFSVQSVCRGLVVSHADLPSNFKVIQIVVSELARALPAIPDPSICA
ncbi:MAG TPA: hypothetical protein VFE15_11375 [Marmoricola sp.]|jgi:triacylglycerol esterase/lipase EstA (alpha/beta hydrolase family)|nr:hypothetical protein [Marmoricola sp.]